MYTMSGWGESDFMLFETYKSFFELSHAIMEIGAIISLWHLITRDKRRLYGPAHPLDSLQEYKGAR